MRAERKGPLLPPQHISHAGGEPRTLTPNPRLDTHASRPDSRHSSATGGWWVGAKILAKPRMLESAVALRHGRRSNPARVTNVGY